MGQSIQSNLLKGGMTVLFRDVMYEVITSQHIKPGKGSAFTKVRFKNLETGRNLDVTLKPVDKIEQLFSEETNMEYLYRSGDNLVLMDQTTYEQQEIPAAIIGDQMDFLIENTVVSARFVEEKLISIEIPNQMVFEITDTDPGFKGDTAQGATKPATVSTGATVNVPLFINPGEKIRIDTRTREYVERAN